MRGRISCRVLIAWLMLMGVAIAQDSGGGQPKDDTETVFVTFRVKDGKAEEFNGVYEKAWAAYQKFKMVLPPSHMLLRGTDDAGKTYFIEIMTWKDHETPDHAPAEVQTIWAQMEALCERRDGHRGIEFTEVHIIQMQR